MRSASTDVGSPYGEEKGEKGARKVELGRKGMPGRAGHQIQSRRIYERNRVLTPAVKPVHGPLKLAGNHIDKAILGLVERVPNAAFVVTRCSAKDVAHHLTLISRAIDMDLTRRPNLGSWLRRCLERPAALAARALREAADAEVPVEVTRQIARNNRL